LDLQKDDEIKTIKRRTRSESVNEDSRRSSRETRSRTLSTEKPAQQDVSSEPVSVSTEQLSHYLYTQLWELGRDKFAVFVRDVACADVPLRSYPLTHQTWQEVGNKKMRPIMQNQK